MSESRAKRHDQSSLLATVIEVKEKHVQDITAQAVMHARLAIELDSAEHARKALSLRDSALWWRERIAQNREQLDKLRRGTSAK